MGRVVAWTGLLAGVVILVAVVIALTQTGKGPDAFGDAPVALGPPVPTEESVPPDTDDATPRQRADESSDQTDTDDDPPEAASNESIANASTVARSARLADVQARSAPTHVSIEALGIVAPIDQVATNADGSMEIPEDIRRAGWFRHGASPGEPTGSVVVTAHVDSRTQGKGAFFPLREATPGDQVKVETATGTVTYEVTALSTYGKAQLPVAELFRTGGEHRLVLITCGGEFDPETRSYAENVVVIAQPVR